LETVLRVIGDHQFHRIQNSHDAFCGLIEIFADTEFQQAYINHVVPALYAYLLTEVSDRLGGIAPSSIAADGGHARIVPSADDVFFNQLKQFPLAHDSVTQVQASKFVLPGWKNTQLFNNPVV